MHVVSMTLEAGPAGSRAAARDVCAAATEGDTCDGGGSGDQSCVMVKCTTPKNPMCTPMPAKYTWNVAGACCQSNHCALACPGDATMAPSGQLPTPRAAFHLCSFSEARAAWAVFVVSAAWAVFVVSAAWAV